MARKDVIEGFKKIENQYLSMLRNVDEYDKALKDKFISQEQFDQAQNLLRDFKINYDRWAYIIYLLNQPSKKVKKPAYDKQNSKLTQHFDKTKSTLKDTMSENDDCLKKFKKYVEELNDECRKDIK